MKLSARLAQRVLGTLPTHRLPEVALEAIEEGYDAPSLWILAGLLEGENPFVTERYFEASLKELRISLPGKRCAALIVAEAFLEDILCGRKPLFEGVQTLIGEALHRYPFFEENQKYVFDSIGFEEAVGLFYSVDELPVPAYWPWQEAKPYAAQLADLEEELLQSLNRWKPRLEKEIAACNG